MRIIKCVTAVIFAIAAMMLLSPATMAQGEEKESQPANYVGKYQLPKFKEGWQFQRYKNWVIRNIEYPKVALDNKSEGKVVVAFVIEEDGSVNNAEAVETPDTLLSNELIRVLKSEKWYAAAQRWNEESKSYEAVKMRAVIPITFNLPVEQPQQPSSNHLSYGMIESSFNGF